MWCMVMLILIPVSGLQRELIRRHDARAVIMTKITGFPVAIAGFDTLSCTWGSRLM